MNKKIIATLSTGVLVLGLGGINTTFADNKPSSGCYINIPGHVEGTKTHKLEMYADEWKEFKDNLLMKGYRVSYKGTNKNGFVVYYIYADKDRTVDEIICLKCKGTKPIVPEIPDEELPPEEELPTVPEEEIPSEPEPVLPEPEKPTEEKPPVELG